MSYKFTERGKTFRQKNDKSKNDSCCILYATDFRYNQEQVTDVESEREKYTQVVAALSADSVSK